MSIAEFLFNEIGAAFNEGIEVLQREGKSDIERSAELMLPVHKLLVLLNTCSERKLPVFLDDDYIAKATEDLRAHIDATYGSEIPADAEQLDADVLTGADGATD